MATTQYNSRYNTKVSVPPMLSGIERINLKNGSVIYPGTDGNIYGVTTHGTAVNLTSGFTADLTGLETAVRGLQTRMTSLEVLMTRAIDLLFVLTDIDINEVPPPLDDE
jgi:hypothetical protein